MKHDVCTLIDGVMNPAEARTSLKPSDEFRTIEGTTGNVGKSLLLQTVQEQEASGLFQVERDPVPDGKVAKSWSRVVRDGKPVDVPTVEDYNVPSANVNEEMYRRLEEPLIFMGKKFDMNETSRNLIRRAAMQGSVFLLSGGAASDMKWHLPADQRAGGNAFAWISADNEPVFMSAEDVKEFGEAVDAREMALRLKARGLKDMSTIPLDFADNKYW